MNPDPHTTALPMPYAPHGAAAGREAPFIDPELAVPIGALLGAVKGAVVGLVTGKLLLCMTLGAVGGAVIGSLVKRVAAPDSATK